MTGSGRPYRRLDCCIVYDSVYAERGRLGGSEDTVIAVVVTEGVEKEVDEMESDHKRVFIVVIAKGLRNWTGY